MADRPHSEPYRQFTVCPGQQHCPADLWKTGVYGLLQGAPFTARCQASTTSSSARWPSIQPWSQPGRSLCLTVAYCTLQRQMKERSTVYNRSQTNGEISIIAGAPSDCDCKIDPNCDCFSGKEMLVISCLLSVETFWYSCRLVK